MAGHDRLGDYNTYAGAWKQEKTETITAPATPAAEQWDGWGTALKPSFEPVIVARKPFPGTVAENVLAWGVGGLNIDGCRVGTDDALQCQSGISKNANTYAGGWKEYDHTGRQYRPIGTGRWPANLIHDGSDEVVGLFPDSKSTGGLTPGVGSKTNPACWSFGDHLGAGAGGYGDTGSAARFFYCAKASKEDRDEGCEGLEEREGASTSNGGKPGKVMTVGAASLNGTPTAPPQSRNHHPTVKPTDLMRYLCRLVTPPGGIILDNFMGSGSTGKAAILEGFDFIGVEQDVESVEIARARIEYALVKARNAAGDFVLTEREKQTGQLALFGGAS